MKFTNCGLPKQNRNSNLKTLFLKAHKNVFSFRV